MQTRPRPGTLDPLAPARAYRRPPRRRRRGRRWPWAAGALVLLCGGALVFAAFFWPSGSVAGDGVALARISRPALGGGVSVVAHGPGGRPVPVVVRPNGKVWATRALPPGAHVTVDVTFHRPGWVSWLAGSTQRERLELQVPASRGADRWLEKPAGAPVEVRFEPGVRVIAIHQGSRVRIERFRSPQGTVSLGDLGAAGSVAISAATRSWIELPPPTTVSWFPTGREATVLAAPRPGSTIGVDTPIRLRFSRPLADVLHGRSPTLEPRVAGRWQVEDAHTLVFRPRGYGFGLDQRVRLHLPAQVEAVAAGGAVGTRTLTWPTATATTLRLQQLLAELGYLPVSWSPVGADVARTVRAQVAAAVRPPRGHFAWRYGDEPASLVALWRPGELNVMTRGAVMAFQTDHGLAADGYAGPDVWRALIAAAIAGTRSSRGYSYVVVHRSVPQSLTLWHDGRVVLTSPANTGIPVAPTELGTFAVYSHLVSTTMSGTNPDGSHYRDPGVPWVSYFNGGDAIHGFNRASYGTAQSLGCVELPPSQAAKVFPYTPVGTLVTILD